MLKIEKLGNSFFLFLQYKNTKSNNLILYKHFRPIALDIFGRKLKNTKIPKRTEIDCFKQYYNL